jgi:2-polyprenyl-6-methoxyphenol hydroxylase-like FAD-dependent oxidoreductase
MSVWVGRGARAADVDVLVVGAGPTGLVLALELVRHGVRCRVIDSEARRPPGSRATDIQSRTLELLEPHGVLPAMVAAGVVVRGFTGWARGRPISQLDFASLEVPYPFTLSLEQEHTEAVLAARLAELGVPVERGVAVDGLLGGTDSVAVRFADGSSGRASYVVGADGVGSRVRQALGVPFRGETYRSPYLVADVHARWSLANDRVHLFVHRDGFFNVLALPGGRSRILCDVPEAQSAPCVDDVRRVLAARTGLDAEIEAASDVRVFRIQRRLAARWRHGRVVLAGDAAHVCSPLLGQGMNFGVHDAVNLAWRLARALRGDGAALDGYVAERRPAASALLWHTDALHRAARLRVGPARLVRDVVSRVVSSVPAARHAAAALCAEMHVSYGPGAARSALGAPRVGPPGVGDRAPLVLTSDGLFPPRAPDGLRLVFGAPAGPGEVGVAAPGAPGSIDARLVQLYRAKAGTRVTVRPDGWIGARER